MEEFQTDLTTAPSQLTAVDTEAATAREFEFPFAPNARELIN